MMRIHSLGTRVVAAILFASHSLMSCSTPQLDKQRFQDATPRVIMDVSNASSFSSTEEEQPTLLQASNDSSIGSELEIHAAPSSQGSQALETAPQERESFIARELAGKTFEPRLGQEVTFYKEGGVLKARTPNISSLEVYMGEVNLAQGLRPRHIHIVSKEQDKNKKGYVYIDQGGLRGGMMENDGGQVDIASNSKQAEKEVSQRVIQERNGPRLGLAHAILSTTGAEADVRLCTYYHLASQLDPLLKEHADLKGGWNLLWQKAQEPELLVNEEAYYKKDHPEAFKRLEAALEEIQLFKDKLATYQPDSLAWQKDLDYLATFYKQFKEKLIQASLDTKDPFELSKLLKPKAVLMGEWWPDAYFRIDQAMARHLIGKDEAGLRREEEKKEATSNHHVSFLPLGIPLAAQVYFKNDGMPHLNPSREYMLYSLYKRLDMAVPASGMLVIDQVKFGEKYNEEPFFLQASVAVPGILAKGPLKENAEVNLEMDHFSKQVLGALLTASVDGKADNYVLTDLSNQKKGLVSIDNDEVFQAPIQRERVHLKSILFFLPAMKEVISRGVDVMLRQVPISWLILEWLDALKSQEESYQRLQTSLLEHGSNNTPTLARKGGRLAKSRIEERWQDLSLPFLDFNSSILPTVSHLFSTMKAYLKERRVATLQELFQVCYPGISLYYQLLQDKASNSPYQALKLLYDPQAPALKELIPLNLGSDNNNNQTARSEAAYFQADGEQKKQSMQERLSSYKEGSQIEIDQVIAYYWSLFKNDLADIGSAIESLQVLVSHGYEEVVNSKAAVALYVQGLGMAQRAGRAKEWQGLFKHLSLVNPALNWLLTLEKHFPPGWILEGKYKEAQYPQEIRGASIGRRHLPKEIEAILLDKTGKFIADKGLTGRAEINFYPKEKPLFYLKKFPELPAYEYGVTAFMRQLGIQEAPRSELFSFYNKEEGLYLVLVSQAIEETPVYKIWEDDSRFAKLDPLYTGRLLVASMLLNPEDSKEDNFILSPDNKYLIPIDNDHAFLPGAIEVKGTFQVYPQLQTKTLAFCLQEMQKPLPSSLVAALTSMNIELFLEAWMKELIQVQSQYQALLPEDKLAKLWKEKGVCMHMPLSPLYIEGLYRKFHLLKTLLIQNPQITPLALLKRLEPYVGSKYEQVMGLPSLKARFQGVSEIYKQSSKGKARLSVANSQRLMEIMEIPDKVLMASPVLFTKGPEAALDQLKKLYKDKGVHSNRLKDLLRGPIESTKRLDKEGEAQLIRQWFKSKEAYDWIMLHESEALKEKHVTSFNFQSKGPLLSALDLRGAKELKESSFMALHNYCPNLVYLNISGWPLEKLGCFKPSGLLGRLELQQEPIFDRLQRLIIEGCKGLQEINLTLGSLESLEAKDNQSLKKLRLSVPAIKYIDISGHQASEEEQVTWFKNLQFNSLPTIKGIPMPKEEAIQEALAGSGDQLELRDKSLNFIDMIYLVNHPLFKEEKGGYQQIDLRENSIGASGAAELAKNLQGTSVQEVDLSNNNIGDRGAAEFAKNLKGTSVQTVDLYNNQIGERGASEFAKNLKGTSVQTVNLSNNKIGERGAAEFAKNLQGTSVQVINLWGNQIGEKGASEFAKNLQGTSVQTVDLGWNQIGASGASEFAKNLQGTSVQTVNLGYNKIGDSGAAAFAKNLQGTSVQTVNLGGNQIGIEIQASLEIKYPHIKWEFEYPFYS
jgi:hypothetical protein